MKMMPRGCVARNNSIQSVSHISYSPPTSRVGFRRMVSVPTWVLNAPTLSPPGAVGAGSNASSTSTLRRSHSISVVLPVCRAPSTMKGSPNTLTYTKSCTRPALWARLSMNSLPTVPNTALKSCSISEVMVILPTFLFQLLYIYEEPQKKYHDGCELVKIPALPTDCMAYGIPSLHCD